MLSVVQHIEERNGEYFVRDSRVLVQSVVIAWQRGVAPEQIREQFPTISLADIYSVISSYLDHQDALDTHFAETNARNERDRLADQAARPEFYAEMRRRIADLRGQRDVAPGEAGKPA